MRTGVLAATAFQAEPAVRRATWLGLVFAGCGQISPPVTDASSDTTAVDAAVDAAPVTDRNCAEVKARLGTATDGVHRIDPDGTDVIYKPFQVFCADMATAAPREYLELRRTTLPAEPTSSNYATFFAGPAHNEFNCACGIITMVFSRIRINPTTLVVDVEDRKFAVFTSNTDATCWQDTPGCHTGTLVILPSYAVAWSCVTGDNASGRGNVDLRDMAFHIAGTDTAMFVPIGFMGQGMATVVDAERKQVNLLGGGDCGGFGASAGLQLAQDS